MQFKSVALSTALLVASAEAFVAPGIRNNQDSFRPLSSLTASDSELDLGMTPELKRVTDAFAAIEQEQVRYKQLLYMAQTTEAANSLPEASKIPENKVPGCLSTVYVDGSAELDAESGEYLINFLGDSDGLMTKGLVALLVRYVALSGFCFIVSISQNFIRLFGRMTKNPTHFAVLIIACFVKSHLEIVRKLLVRKYCRSYSKGGSRIYQTR